MQAAEIGQEAVRDRQRIGVARTAAEDERQQLVIAERRHTQTFEFFSRAIVRCHIFHRYTQFLMRCLVLCACVVAACLVSACAEPPSKEMAQAQGAIDAARAVGAERYASQEFSAATTALAQSNEAVTQRDFRLALNHALESREHAQNAAREAADARARIRGEVERSMAEITALLAQANNGVTDAEAERTPRAALRNTRQALAEVNSAVQKAGAAMKADDYLAAEPILKGVKEQVEKAIADLDEARPGRRRR